MKDVLAEPEISASEAILGIIFAIGVGAIGFAIVDIVIHNFYILPLVSNCYNGNTNQICTDVLQKLGVNSANNQIALADAYYYIQSGIVLVTGITLASIRIVFGYLAGARNYTMLIFTGFMWFMSSTFLFYTGWIDTLYYLLRNIKIPMTLPWLNEAGLFQIVKVLGKDPNMVEGSDLIVLNIIGLVVLIFFWVWIHYHHSKDHLEKLGIK